MSPLPETEPEAKNMAVLVSSSSSASAFSASPLHHALNLAVDAPAHCEDARPFVLAREGLKAPGGSRKSLLLLCPVLRAPKEDAKDLENQLEKARLEGVREGLTPSKRGGGRGRGRGKGKGGNQQGKGKAATDSTPKKEKD